MTTIQAIIMGIVEGVTEFLPISSTAHLEITSLMLRLPASEFIKSFIIIIQLGAILAVVFLYRQKIFSSSAYIKNILIAFIPTGVIGFVLYKVIKSFLLGNILVAAAMLLLGGIILVLFERKYRNAPPVSGDQDIAHLSTRSLLVLGSAQALAVVPGVSRSGAVIVAGRMLGLPKALITEFSFLLAVPTMLAATSYDILKSGFSFEKGDWISLAIGFIVSFGIAMVVIRWLLAYIQKHSFAVFGWYRIILGALLIFYFYIL